MSSIMVQDSYTMERKGLAIHTFGLCPQVCKSLNLPFPLYNTYLMYQFVCMLLIIFVVPLYIIAKYACYSQSIIQTTEL